MRVQMGARKIEKKERKMSVREGKCVFVIKCVCVCDCVLEREREREREREKEMMQ